MNQSLVTYSEVICLVTSNLVKDDGKNCVPLLTPRGIILTHRRGGHGFTTTCSSVVAAAGAAFAARRRLINNCGVWRDAAGDGVSRLGTGSGTCGWKRRHRSPRIPTPSGWSGSNCINNGQGRVAVVRSTTAGNASCLLGQRLPENGHLFVNLPHVHDGSIQIFTFLAPTTLKLKLPSGQAVPRWLWQLTPQSIAGQTCNILCRKNGNSWRYLLLDLKFATNQIEKNPKQQ